MIDAPAAYSHPYGGVVIEHRLTLADIARLCGSDALSCSMRPTCHVWLPIDVSPVILFDLRKHELAHCKGWPSDHPRR